MNIILQNGYVPQVAEGPFVWTVIVLYFVLVLGIGGYFFRKSRRSTADFWVASGEIPGWVQTFAFVSVLASAGSFFGIGGGAYDGGITFIMGIVGAAMGGMVLMSIFIAGPIRRSGVYTVPDYLKVRYQSDRVRLVAAVIFAIASWAYLVPQLVAGGITMEFISPLPSEIGILIVAVVFALYVSIGGFWAVTWTDFIQGIVLSILAVAPIPILIVAFGGASEIITGASANSPTFLSTVFPPMTLLGAAVVWLLSPLALPQFGQRLLSSKSEAASRVGIMWQNVIYMTIFLLSSVFVAGAAMAIEPNLATGDYFYYMVLEEYTGPVFQGLGAAGLLAAVMSTTDALLIALSVSVSHDIPKTLGYEFSEKTETRLGAVIIWAGVLSAAVVAFDPPGVIVELTTIVAGGAAAGLFPALAVGTWWKRANAAGAIAAMIVGFGLYGALFFAEVLPPLSEVLVAVPVGFATFVIVSLVTRQPTSEELKGFLEFHQYEQVVEEIPDSD